MAHTPRFAAPLRPALDRTVGRILGTRYRVLSRLGEGGMGTVYLCEHAVLGRRYAVKVLRPDLADDPEIAERFRNEAIAASRIGGDHVVDVVDFGVEEDGALFYVMEALDGRSLGAIVSEEGPLEVDRALGLLGQVCRALAAAHDREVVHRDVKPDNVFVVRRADGAEQAKVIDFGISQVSVDPGGERLTRTGTIIGTPEYMAPEQAAGEPVDHRADVYALGVLAYEILTGTLPILAHTPVATLVAHQTRAPEPPSHRRPSVPSEVDALILRALAKRPADRPQTMREFAEEIARIRRRRSENSVPGTAGATTRTQVRGRDTIALPEAARTHRRSNARRVLVVAIVAIGILAGLGSAWWASRKAGETGRAADVAVSGPAPSAARSTTPAVASAVPGTASGTASAAVPGTASSTSVPASIAPEKAPEDAARTAASPATSAVTPSRAKSPKEPARPTRTPRKTDPHLQDPYQTGAPLKSDPFP
jgi:serine/threonine-protein kinase